MSSPFKLPLVLDLTCLDWSDLIVIKIQINQRFQHIFQFQLQVVIGGMIKHGKVMMNRIHSLSKKLNVDLTPAHLA